MELPILAVLLVSFVLSVDSHPKRSDVLPKDYYKRQILQPIPGYIPVYIKADEVPIVRSGSKTHSHNVQLQKGAEAKEKKSFKETEGPISPESQEKSSDEVKSKSSEAEPKTPITKLQKSVEPAVTKKKNEKQAENSPVKLVDVKPQN